MNDTIDSDLIGAYKAERDELERECITLHAERKTLHRALLLVRVAMGLHRDSNEDLVEYAERLRAERDALREALAELLDCHVPGACGSRTYRARENARSALSKSKG